MGVTVGDEVMVFLSLRLLRGALSPLQELVVFWEGCAWHIGIESLLCGNLRERVKSWLESVRLSCLGAGGGEGMESEGWGRERWDGSGGSGLGMKAGSGVGSGGWGRQWGAKTGNWVWEG